MLPLPQVPGDDGGAIGVPFRLAIEWKVEIDTRGYVAPVKIQVGGAVAGIADRLVVDPHVEDRLEAVFGDLNSSFRVVDEIAARLQVGPGHEGDLDCFAPADSREERS